MKGKILNVMRKWWLMALVCSLALSLTSCAKRRNYNYTGAYGFTQCDGPNWRFDVYTFRSTAQAGTFELIVMPVSIDTPGDIASVTIGNSQNGYKQLISQVVLNPQEEIYAGVLTSADLNNYPILAIANYDPSSNFINQYAQKISICEIPLPGEGVPQGQQQYFPY